MEDASQNSVLMVGGSPRAQFTQSVVFKETLSKSRISSFARTIHRGNWDLFRSSLSYSDLRDLLVGT